MKRIRRGPEQIIRKLHESEGMLSPGRTIGEVYQKLEISERTFHRGVTCTAGRRATMRSD